MAHIRLLDEAADPWGHIASAVGCEEQSCRCTRSYPAMVRLSLSYGDIVGLACRPFLQADCGLDGIPSDQAV